MLDIGFDELINKIIHATAKSKEEVLALISSKKDELNNLVSNDGAAYIIAQELGVKLSPESNSKGFVDLSSLVGGLKSVNVVGRISRIYPIRTFTKGKGGKVVNIVLWDGKSDARLTLWNDHVSGVEKGELTVGDVLAVSNAFTKRNDVTNSVEIHGGSRTVFTLNPDLEHNIPELPENMVSTQSAGNGSFSFGGVVTYVFDLKTFNFCNDCNKKSDSDSCSVDSKHGVEKRGLFSFVMDNSKESFRVVVFNDLLGKFLGKPFSEVESIADGLFGDKKEELLGSFIVVSGRKNFNDYTKSDEIISSDIDFKPDFEKLAEKL